MIHMNKLIAVSFVALLAALAPLGVSGAEKADKAEKPKAERKQSDHIPFHGKIESVNAAAKSFTIGDRTFLVSSETKIVSKGKPETFAVVTAGEDVGGAYRKGDGGKLEVLSLRVGPKPPPKDGKKEGEKSDK
jgi:hypothetical protein